MLGIPPGHYRISRIKYQGSILTQAPQIDFGIWRHEVLVCGIEKYGHTDEGGLIKKRKKEKKRSSRCL